MARRKVEIALQVCTQKKNLCSNNRFYKSFQQEVNTQDEWNNLLEKDGLIGKL